MPCWVSYLCIIYIRLCISNQFLYISHLILIQTEDDMQVNVFIVIAYVIVLDLDTWLSPSFFQTKLLISHKKLQLFVSCKVVNSDFTLHICIPESKLYLYLKIFGHCIPIIYFLDDNCNNFKIYGGNKSHCFGKSQLIPMILTPNVLTLYAEMLI